VGLIREVTEDLQVEDRLNDSEGLVPLATNSIKVRPTSHDVHNGEAETRTGTRSHGSPTSSIVAACEDVGDEP
jgi:hypothetical protein